MLIGPGAERADIFGQPFFWPPQVRNVIISVWQEKTLQRVAKLPVGNNITSECQSQDLNAVLTPEARFSSPAPCCLKVKSSYSLITRPKVIISVSFLCLQCLPHFASHFTVSQKLYYLSETIY